MTARIVSVGSLNLDLTVTTPRLPAADETLLGSSLAEFRGGKGANQAVAAARLGASVAMVGCVGHDARGQFLLEGIDAEGVDRRWVRRVDAPTGVAVITVADDGDITIVVVPGANGSVTPDVVVAGEEAITSADVLVVQGEIPVGSTRRAAELARSAGTTVVLNPAPFDPAVADLMSLVDVLVVNRAEAAQLGAVDVPALITTRGGAPTIVEERGGGQVRVAGYPAEVVDPTGAGDTFVAALAVRLAEGAPLIEAVKFANAAGACAVEVAGAQSSLPSRAQVEARLA